MLEPAGPRDGSALTALAVLAGVFSLASALHSARVSDWTYDEPHHLEYSERLLDRGVSERASAERFNSKTPVSLLNVVSKRAAAILGVRDPRSLLFAARLPTVLALGALLAATWLGARWLLGARAAALATLGVALDPNLVAHGSLVTVDVYYALGAVLTVLLGIALARRPTTGRALALGAALGFALTAKFTGLLLVAGLLFLGLARPREGTAPLRAALGVITGVAALLVVSAAYLGADMLQPLGSLGFRSTPLRAIAETLPGLALPIPSAFLSGIDQSLATDRAFRPIVAFGRQYPGGTVFYFPALWLLKTPILLWLAQLAGLVAFARSAELRSAPALRFLGLNLALALLFFSFVFRTQIGYRYVLAGIPLAWILAAAGLARGAARVDRAFALAAVAAAIEVAAYWGNPLSFTNALVWPKRNAYRLLADSNLDWGQNNDKIRPALLARGLPLGSLDPLHVLAGVNVIPVNALAGVMDWERHRFVREHLEPIEEIGHTHLVYEASPAVFEAFLNERRRVEPHAGAAGICTGRGLPSPVELSVRDPVPFRRSTGPTGARTWIACLETRDGADISFDLHEGRARFGRYSAGDCRFEWLSEGQGAWYRLSPGRHAFCALPLATEGPPQLVQGAFTLRRGAASFVIRADPRPAASAPVLRRP
jgi:4-amino-4-deoxy-L-arabinose transferase-like glycosyltransferase